MFIELSDKGGGKEFVLLLFILFREGGEGLLGRLKSMREGLF